MMRSKRLRVPILALMILVVFAAGIFIVNKKIINKYYDGGRKYSEFWEDPGRYDVWLMGTSHMYYAIHPVNLYEEYGISSYNISAPSSFLPATYWTLRCALEKGKPDMIVVDTYHVQKDYPVVGQQRKVNAWMDSMPLSISKYKAIRDLMPDIGKRKTLRYCFPYSVFNEKKSVKNYSLPLSPTMGCKNKPFVVDYSNKKVVDKQVCHPQNTMGYDYLIRIIQLCKEKDIKLVLTAWPALLKTNPDSHPGMNAVASIAEEYEIPFLNSMYDNVFDLSIDFGDKNSHLNLLGANKALHYLGDYLSENYEFEAISEGESEYWDEAIDNYYQYIKERMAENDELVSQLLWMQDNSMRITYYKNEKIKEDKLVDKLIKELNNARKDSLKNVCKIGHTVVDSADYVFAIKVNDVLLDTVIIQDGVRIN